MVYHFLPAPFLINPRGNTSRLLERRKIWIIKWPYVLYHQILAKFQNDLHCVWNVFIVSTHSVLLLHFPTFSPYTIASAIWDYLWFAPEWSLLSKFFFLKISCFLDSYNIIPSRGATKSRRTAGLQSFPTLPQIKFKKKNTDFVDTMILNVIHDLHF